MIESSFSHRIGPCGKTVLSLGTAEGPTYPGTERVVRLETRNRSFLKTVSHPHTETKIAKTNAEYNTTGITPVPEDFKKTICLTQSICGFFQKNQLINLQKVWPNVKIINRNN